MEANSINPVKVDFRPAGAQAQGALGALFQDLLNASAWQLDPPAAPPRPDPVEPRRAPAAARTDAAIRPRAEKPDDKNNDIAYAEAPAPADPQPVRGSADTGQQATPADKVDPAAPGKSAASGQPAQDGAAKSAAANAGTATQEEKSGPVTAAGTPANPQVAAAATAGLLADAGAAPEVPAASSAAVTDQSTATAGGAAQTSTKANNPAPAAPAPQAATPAGNGLVATVTVKTAPVVSQPAATLGGGAATAALADPAVQGPAGPGAAAASPVASGAPSPGAATAASQGQVLPETANPNAGAQNAQADAADAQVLPAQAAATLPSKQAANLAAPAADGSDTPAGAGAGADGEPSTAPVQTSHAAPARSGVTTGNPPPNPGDGDPASFGQTASASGDGSKPANPPSHEPRTAPQTASDTALKAQTQAGPQANLAAAVAPAVPAQAFKPAGLSNGTGGAAASGAAVEAVASLDSGPAPVTGGIAQPVPNAPGGLASQTLSGAAASTPADQVAIEILKAVGAGKDHVRVRLHPAELGQIDISLKVRHDGTIRAVVTTDRPDTFDLLQRDSRGLERALHDAGLKTDSGSLSFNLRGGENNGPNTGQRGFGGTVQTTLEADRTASPPPAEVDVPIPVVSNRALDIRV